MEALEGVLGGHLAGANLHIHKHWARQTMDTWIQDRSTLEESGEEERRI